MFLTKEEVYELTGKRAAEKQIAWLDDHGISYYLLDGAPQVEVDLSTSCDPALEHEHPRWRFGYTPSIGGFIYVIQTKHASGERGNTKVGISVQPEHRLTEIFQWMKRTGGLRISPSFALTIYSRLPKDVERAAHAALDDLRVGGEWFDVSPEEAIEVVRREAERAKRELYGEFK